MLINLAMGCLFPRDFKKYYRYCEILTDVTIANIISHFCIPKRLFLIFFCFQLSKLIVQLQKIIKTTDKLIKPIAKWLINIAIVTVASMMDYCHNSTECLSPSRKLMVWIFPPQKICKSWTNMY